MSTEFSGIREPAQNVEDEEEEEGDFIDTEESEGGGGDCYFDSDRC